MPLPLDDKSVEKGYCLGEYEVTVDVGPRIRLPRPILKVLKDHKVLEVWRYPDPTGQRMVICPAQNRLTYIKLAKQHLPESIEPDEANRRFICTGEPVNLSDHGQVSITLACNRNLNIVAGQQVVIIGVGHWYEVWRQDDWLGIGKSDIKG
jgi:DNA-binding transcriptional regulator/RsmH inhibitor MraZ